MEAAEGVEAVIDTPTLLFIAWVVLVLGGFGSGLALVLIRRKFERDAELVLREARRRLDQTRIGT